MARTFCILIALSTQALFSGDLFWFSYKIATSNGLVVYEEKNIAPVMVPYDGQSTLLCTLPLPFDTTLSKEAFLRKHFDTILPCFYRLSTHMLSLNERNLKHQQDRIELIIEPVRFTVDFKDEFATINAVR